MAKKVLKPGTLAKAKADVPRIKGEIGKYKREGKSEALIQWMNKNALGKAEAAVKQRSGKSAKADAVIRRASKGK